MDNTTLEQVEKEEKKRYKKETYQAFFYIAVVAGSFWGMLEGIEYLQMKIFSAPDSFVTTTIRGFLYQIMLALLCLYIIPYILEFIFFKRLILKKGRFSKNVLLLAISCLPILYLSFFNYVDIGKDSITYDPFWPGEKKTYGWGEINGVVIDRADRRNKRFDYYVYFEDGTHLDIWGDTRMKIDELKLVDDWIRANGIPKYMEDPPDVKRIKEVYKKHPERDKILEQILSE